jgi:hypothetical protein
MLTNPMTCSNCTTDYNGNFCPNCGEKKFDKKQLSFRHFMEEVLEGIGHLDNKFFRTLKTVVSKPGKLSLDFTEGRRASFMKPVQFFLIINVVFFFLTTGRNLYSLGLDNYVQFKPFTNFNTVKIVDQKLQKTGFSFAEYRLIFNEKMSSDSKEFIFLFVPFYGLIFFLILFWKKKYLSEHMVFASHFIAFVLIWSLVSSYLINLPFYLITGDRYSEHFDFYSSIFTILVLAVYLTLAIRRFYRIPVWSSILISIFLGASFFEFIQYYRMLLFYKIVNLG